MYAGITNNEGKGLPVKLVRKKIQSGSYRLVDAVNPHQAYAYAHLNKDGRWGWSLVEGITFKDPTKPTEGTYDLLVVLTNKVNSMVNTYGVKWPDAE